MEKIQQVDPVARGDEGDVASYGGPGVRKPGVAGDGTAVLPGRDLRAERAGY